jgi:hypothetical protein
MKKISLILSSLLVSGILFTGCVEPLTPEKFNSRVSDNQISKAYWQYFDNTKKEYNYSNRYESNSLYINERLSNFSPMTVNVGNIYNFSVEKSNESNIYETYKKLVLERGNKIGIYKGSFNETMMKIKLRQPKLPYIYDQKIYYFDATPLYAEFDKEDNLISLMISYTESYASFNHVNNPSAPAEVNLKTELYFGNKILPFKNSISKRDWQDNLINMIEPIKN